MENTAYPKNDAFFEGPAPASPGPNSGRLLSIIQLSKPFVYMQGKNHLFEKVVLDKGSLNG